MNLKNFVVLILLFWSIHSENVSDQSNEQNATKTTSENHSKRLIKINSVTMDFIVLDPLKKERTKFELMPPGPDNTGALYLDLKERGFKFTFRKRAGIELKVEKELQPADYLEKIFKPEIGQYNMSDVYTLSSVRLYQPMKDTAPFEFSQLRDQCWRVDVFPNVETNCEQGACKEYSLNLKFCVRKNDDNLTVRKYGYLLEAKELDHTNKE